MNLCSKERLEATELAHRRVERGIMARRRQRALACYETPLFAQLADELDFWHAWWRSL